MIEMARYSWSLSVRKVSEGGEGIGTALDMLRGHKGIVATSQHSPYVGDSGLLVRTNSLENMRRALSILKSYGYITNIEDEMKYRIRGER